MNKKAILTAVILIFASIGILFYKIYFLKIPFLPYKSQNNWRYDIKINKTAYSLLENQLPDKIYLPIPPNLDSQYLTDLKIENQKHGSILETSTGKLFEVSKDDLLKYQNFKIEASILITNQRVPLKNTFLDEEAKSHYLSLSSLSEDELAHLKTLNSSIIYKDDNQQEIFDKIAYFILDEFVIKPEIQDFKEVIEMKNGDSLNQAKLFMALCRLNNIPTRISFGTTVIDAESDKKVKHMRLFINEYYMGDKWMFFHPDFPNIGTMPKNFLLIHRDITPALELFNSRDYYSIQVKPIRKTFFDSKEYYEKTISHYDHYSSLSLYRLPLGTQNIFFTLLLIPLGTLILSIARNLIGIITFGVFTPILLTLFFLETAFIASFIFLISVFIVGIILHFLLNKLYLLAVPRLSIMLTVVIIMYVGFALITAQLDQDSNTNYSLNYFPIVIVSVFTERFMILLREEGVKNTIKTFLGTMLISTLCYAVFSIDILSLIIFNNPELLLITIGLNVFIGSYTGFRLNEFFRFKEILKKT
ncbi:MAG: hypothetical protein H6625_06410 [Bdellovibrionaceae bacterium]|nr:hypothetical protein [Pseudobdellovibrionaceae bacterium]